MSGHARDELTQLGFYGLIPFIATVAVLWLSPLLIPQYVATDFHYFTLAYAGIVVAYLSGIGAGSVLTPGASYHRSFVPGILVVLAAVIASLPPGTFFFSIGGVWRHLIILLLLIYLLLRDLNNVRAGLLPAWYGELRTRLTLWASASIVLIMVRLYLWGYY